MSKMIEREYTLTVGGREVTVEATLAWTDTAPVIMFNADVDLSILEQREVYEVLGAKFDAEGLI